MNLCKKLFEPNVIPGIQTFGDKKTTVFPSSLAYTKIVLDMNVCYYSFFTKISMAKMPLE